jgi:hypothetical protein
MTKEQMKAVIELMAGLEIAVTHVCAVLESKGLATNEALAASFESTGDAAPGASALPLRHIADMLRRRSADPAGDLARLLH